MLTVALRSHQVLADAQILEQQQVNVQEKKLAFQVTCPLPTRALPSADFHQG